MTKKQQKDMVENPFEEELEAPKMRHYCAAPTISDPDQLKMMDLVEKISKSARHCMLSEEYFAFAKPYIELLMQRQGLKTREEALLLSVIINLGGLSGAHLEMIVNYLGCDNIAGLKMRPVFKKLFYEGFVESSERGFSNSYTVPDRLLDDYNSNKPFVPFHVVFKEDKELFYFIEDKLVELNGFSKDTDDIKNKIAKALKENSEMPMIRRVREMASDDDKDTLLLLHFCAELELDNERKHNMREVGSIFRSLECSPSVFHRFSHGQCRLFKEKIVEYCTTPDGLVDSDFVRMTDATVKKLMPDYKPKEISDSMICANIIKPEQLKETHLFFDEKFGKQVSDLESLLDEENFKRVQDTLVANGFRKGFCSLFYGAPGTGKTALAKELARRTRRSIMLVDLSSVRDKFVGESEKNVQAIFDGYKELAACSKRTPILVLNEADALIGKRNENSTTGVEKMENAMQNIMLQGMEDFDGILIATTNLAGGMDPAFDRRFLYKLEFPKPGKEVRAKIWQSKMPGISMPVAMKLAAGYSFSGGQIENVARKTLVNSILHGEEKAMGDIVACCQNEIILSGNETQKIGF